MNDINIKVVNKIATNATPDVHLVCGNSDYTVTFDFDAEWDTEVDRIARFTYYHGRNSFYKEQPFTGDTAKVPILSNIDYVLVGVYAGDLSTTTPARVRCKKSILCGGAVEHITPKEKKSLQAQIGDLDQLGTNDKTSIVNAFNELLRNGGATEEQIAAAVTAYLAENPVEGTTFETDETLTLENGVLSVNTTNDMEQDNTLPITSAGVFATVGNIESLLKTI